MTADIRPLFHDRTLEDLWDEPVEGPKEAHAERMEAPAPPVPVEVLPMEPPPGRVVPTKDVAAMVPRAKLNSGERMYVSAMQAQQRQD